MALNSWQKIDRVLPGRPFGNGSSGAYTSSTIPSITYKSCSGSSSSQSLTIASAGFTNGDIVLIHQTRGTGATQWEINRITSGGGTTTLTLQQALHYTYTDSGASQAQIVNIPMYSSMNITSGTWSPNDWDGDVGGMFAYACNGTATQAHTLELNGASGSHTTSEDAGGATGGGFRGGGVGFSSNGLQGEGTAGAGSASTSANGNGGGGGNRGGGDTGGGGGANVVAGSNSDNGGTGGSAVGATDLTTMSMGGGGGGSTQDNQPDGAEGGGSGGGMIIGFVKNLVETGAVQVNGGSGGNGVGGGAGAGGSILYVVQTAILGSNLITATAGTGGTLHGGNGAVGNIAIHHSGTVTGTTNPTYNNITDGTLVESDGGALMGFLGL